MRFPLKTSLANVAVNLWIMRDPFPLAGVIVFVIINGRGNKVCDMTDIWIYGME
jgi:hypothetical protein